MEAQSRLLAKAFQTITTREGLFPSWSCFWSPERWWIQNLVFIILTLGQGERTPGDFLDDSRGCLAGGKGWVSFILNLGEGQRTLWDFLDDKKREQP